MKQAIKLEWLENMAFESLVDGHKLIVDSKQESGGNDKGPRPKTLMLVALAGCTAMDVISILKKMRVEIESFTVEVEGNVAEEHPKKFTSMHIIYEFKGKNLPFDKLEKAVILSQEKYCGVSASYKPGILITHKIKIS